MLNFVRSFLKNENIDLVSSISLNECVIKRPYLLEKVGISQGSVIIFAVPYLTCASCEKRNVSSYAVSRDYHLFFKQLFDNILSELKERYPKNKFAAFTDHSPIDEIKSAAMSGLGVVGKNHLLITEKYSSYVFLGEIITDATLSSNTDEIKYCAGCNSCIRACPVKTDISLCLSSLTQKKGELSESEKELIKKSGCVWGCDICQEVCPYTKKAIKNNTIYSTVDYFNQDLMPYITSDDINVLSDSEFMQRAYSWRGRDTVLRNLLISEGKKDVEKPRSR